MKIREIHWSLIVAAVAVLALGTMACGGAPTAPQSAVGTSGVPPAGSATLEVRGGVEREAVCHAAGSGWRLLQLPAPAAALHLGSHDDARPGETTPSGVMLDGSCVAAAAPAVCPCYDTPDIIALFAPGEPVRNLTCGASASSTFIHDLDPARDPKWLVESFLQFDGGDFWTCEQTVLGGSHPDEIPQMRISQAEHDACRAVITAAQSTLGC